MSIRFQRGKQFPNAFFWWGFIIHFIETRWGLLFRWAGFPRKPLYGSRVGCPPNVWNFPGRVRCVSLVCFHLGPS